MATNNIDNSANNVIPNKTLPISPTPAVKRLDKAKEPPPRKKSRERGDR